MKKTIWTTLLCITLAGFFFGVWFLKRDRSEGSKYFRDGGGEIKAPLSDTVGFYVWYEPTIDVMIVVESGDRLRFRSNALISVDWYISIKAGPEDSNLFITFHVDRTTRSKLLWISADMKPQWIKLPSGAGATIYSQLEKRGVAQPPLLPVLDETCKSLGIDLPAARHLEEVTN